MIIYSEISREAVNEVLRAALYEDTRTGDVTTEAMEYRGHASARIVAKQSGVLSGIDVAEAVFLMMDSEVYVSRSGDDGMLLEPGQTILEIKGNGAAILTAERTALNFLGRMSGVATLTRKYVEEIMHTGCRLLDTRKTMPLLRDFDKYAVACGGARNHRRGLYDMILIKENHIRYAGSLEKAIERAIIWRDNHAAGMQIEVETTSLDECRRAMRFPVNVIMLDHFSLEDMREAVRVKPAWIRLEASGDVNLKTVGEIAATGVDYISVGAITHSAPSFDFSLLFKEENL